MDGKWHEYERKWRNMKGHESKTKKIKTIERKWQENGRAWKEHERTMAGKSKENEKKMKKHERNVKTHTDCLAEGIFWPGIFILFVCFSARLFPDILPSTMLAYKKAFSPQTGLRELTLRTSDRTHGKQSFAHAQLWGHWNLTVT